MFKEWSTDNYSEIELEGKYACGGKDIIFK